MLFRNIMLDSHGLHLLLLCCFLFQLRKLLWNVYSAPVVMSLRRIEIALMEIYLIRLSSYLRTVKYASFSKFDEIVIHLPFNSYALRKRFGSSVRFDKRFEVRLGSTIFNRTESAVRFDYNTVDRE